MPRRNANGGCIQPHQRDTSDNVEIIGGDFESRNVSKRPWQKDGKQRAEEQM